jgi:predicted Zn finger-like uncharacterized protein
MAVEALCPTCGAVFNLSDDYVGKKVRCKKCEHIFTVADGRGRPRDDEAVQSDRGAVSSKRTAREDTDDRAGRSPAAKRGRDDDDDDRPRKRPSRGRDDDDDDDDERGRSGKRKRVFHDNDDDDDRPRARRKKSGSGTLVAIICGVVFVLLLVCGGGLYGFIRLVQAADDAVQDDMAQAFDVNGNPMGFPPGAPFMGPEKQPRDVAEALTFLKGNDPGERRGAANWLARQQQDPARQKEVAAALESVVRDLDDNTCDAGARALRVWGTKDNGPALADALRQRLPDKNRPFFSDVQKDLMHALAQVKYEPGAEVVCEFLPNFFASSNGEPEKALDEFGPPAEKAVVKYFNHPDGGTHDRARRLIQRYNTKPVVILDQTVDDLRAVEPERNKAAAQWLSNTASDEALAFAKTDPARRTAVAVGLNNGIDHPQAFFEDTLLAAVKRWGTKDNVPALVRFLQQSPFKKHEIGDALIALGPVCEPEVKPLLNHRDGGVVNEARRILEGIGSADAKYAGAVADLKSDDGGRIERGARALQGAAVDEKQRPTVVAALLGTIHDTGVGRGDHQLVEVSRALVVWAGKDDGPAIVGKVREMHKFFCRESRRILIEWMGKQKLEKAIPFLAEALTDKDDSKQASQALQAMGTELGEVIEGEVAKVNATGRDQLLECVNVLGAVGTKKSLDVLKKLQAAALRQKDQVVAQACATAANAITARGK